MTEQSRTEPGTEAKLAPAAGISVAGIAVTLGQELLKRMGTKAVSAAFPPSMPSYFDQVYKQITKIVKASLRENTIDVINGEINGVQQWVKTVYEVHKGHGDWSKDKLIAELQIKIDLLFGVVGTLEQPNYSGAGFSVFMVAGGLQLALMQEQTLQDPNVSDPRASPYATSLRNRAQSLYNYGLETFIGILLDRVDSVKVEKTRVERDNWVGAPTVQRWRWHDRVLDKSKEYSSEEEATAAMKAHVVRVCNELVEKVAYPMTTASNWLSLATGYDASPLYRCNTSSVNGYFFDYSNAQDYANRVGIHVWTGHGIFGWMGGKDGKQPGADVPVYRLVAEKDTRRVLIVFDPTSYREAQTAGWSGQGEGRGLLGFLWRDPSKVPAGQAVAVYSLTAQGVGLNRTMLTTSPQDYEAAQRAGWERTSPAGIVGYLCSQG